MPGNIVEELIEIEADLTALSHQVASILKDPEPSDFARQLDRLWRQIAVFNWPYNNKIRSLRPNAADYDLMPGSLAAERRNFQRLGPVRGKMWPQIGQLVTRQMQPYFEPLVTETNNRHRGREDGYLHDMMRALFILANPLAGDADRVPALNHRDIGLSGPYFVNLMAAGYRLALAQRRERPLRFIDVGSGGGTKVFTASSFFEYAEGLEYDAGYVAHARDWMDRVGAPGCKIVQGDALDYTNFAEFDVIYMYRPIKDRPLQVRLEDQVFAQARPGTIVIAPLNYSLIHKPKTLATPVTDVIYLAHSTVEKAATLRHVAERLGPDQGLDDPQMDRDMGFWQPILQASRNRGYEVAP